MEDILMNKRIFGVGINDATYKTRIRTKTKGIEKTLWECPFYKRWVSMLNRVYNSSKSKCPTYEGCSVCEEWLTFSNFKAWMEQQDWEGKHLDKDLLVYNNKVYSPETCIFIPASLNSCLVSLKQRNSNKKLPIGVDLVSTKNMKSEPMKPYRARCTVDGTHIDLGTYHTKESAHKAWQIFKVKSLQNMLISEDYSDEIAHALQNIINTLEYEIANNIITGS
ncbi:MAG: hypothetical protein ACMV1B_12410 [Prevotella sp.]